MNKQASGFTLVELLIVTVVAAVMLAAIFQTLVVQQQSYREQNAIINARQTARTSVEVLAAELREISATDGDLVRATADSLAFRAYRKVGVVCKRELGVKVHYWELGDPFVANDRVMIFVDDNPDTSADDGWLEAVVSNVGSGSCDESWNGRPVRAMLTSPVSYGLAVRPGAPIRGFEYVIYGHYRVDDEWVVGRRAPGASVEPLIGPVASPEEGGLRFRYFDENNVELADLPLDAADRQRVARIEVSVSGLALGTGAGKPERLETLVTQVSLRGNVWN